MCSSDVPGSGAKIGTPVSSRSSWASGAAAAASILATVRPKRSTSTGRNRPEMMSAVSSPNRSTEHGCEQASDAERGQQEELEHAEHPSQHLVRDGALHQRVAGDVDERVAGTHHREEQESAPATVDHSPSTARGTPQSSRPMRKPGLSRRAPVSPSAPIAPTSAPTPKAALR